MYKDDILTIKKLEGGELHYKFRAPKGMSEKRLISTFLTYFIPELPYFSKDAQVDLLTCAYELCKDKISKTDKKFLTMLKYRDSKVIDKIIWNKILAIDGMVIR